MLKEIQVPLEQVPCVHLVRDVGEVVAPAVGHDHTAARLEHLEVVRDLGTEEVGRGQCGPRGIMTGMLLAFTRFMIPWMELARKLSKLLFMVRR